MNTKYFHELIREVLAIKGEKELQTFFRGLFTPKELEKISVRLQIVKLLKQGLPQRAIAKKLKVGIATVTRGSREINNNRF
jgi:TrpR family trp operon transcriptional repressor